LQDADAFIISTKNTDLYRYGISLNKLHEYMAAARPTIFAGNSHNNPIAEAAAGITVAPEDSRAIAAAVETLAGMSIDEKWNMGLRARQYIEEHHDFAGLARRLERVLQSALDSPEDVQTEAQNIDIDRTATLKVKNASTQ
jgi:glycosyltransferase involved in cell wall biosynthesis